MFKKRIHVDGEEDEESTGYDGRRPKAYVRFDPKTEKQSGPMFGPFDGMDLQNDIVQGWKKAGAITRVAERRSDGLWYVHDIIEPGYFGFSIIFS